MAFSFGKKIITQGLEFYVDAANYSSYPRFGSSWNDLVNGTRNGTLTNSPAYTYENAGGLVFDSASLETFSFPNVPITTESFAYDLWIKPSSYKTPSTPGNGSAGGANWPGMLSTVNIVDYLPIPGQSTGVAIGFFGFTDRLAYGAVVTGSTANPPIALRGWDNYTGSVAPTLNTSSIYNIVVQRNNDTSHLELYVNGVYYSRTFIPDSTYSMSGSFQLRSSIRSPSSVDSFYPNGTYYAIKIYKGKYLTQQEITQNYNALKGRFGL